jgi:hypothetical protein
MEESFFRCIPQRKKTSSIVSHNGGKYLPLWDTTEENLRRCGIQCGRFFWDTVHCTRFCCGIGYNGRKVSCVVGYNRKKFVCHHEIVLRCIPQRKKSSSFVSHNGGKPSPLYPTAEKKIFRCIPQRKKPLPLYPTTAKKTLNLTGFTKKNFSKMILTQEDKFDEKKMEAKNLVILSL